MIQPCGVEDIPKLHALIHSAYRGEGSRRGWTTEADILDGSRVYESTLQKYIESPNSVLLKYTVDEEFPPEKEVPEERILGCIHLQRLERGGETKAYLGLLTVSPELQGRGIGKELLQFASDWARSQACISVYMTVISARTELISWYERHGFSKTEEMVEPPFNNDSEFGVPKMPLEFVVLEKRL
jgi:GNAT superfamily N-acetyltransferase